MHIIGDKISKNIEILGTAVKSITPTTLRIILGITLVVILLAVGAVIYAIYYCFTTGYPRIFSVGHSEEFDGYMQNYMMDIVNHMKVIHDYSNSKSDSKNILIPIMNALYDDNIIPVRVQGGAKGPLQFNDIPLFYIYYMFRDALASDKAGILAIFRNINNGQTTITFSNSMTLNMYNTSGTKVNPAILDGQENKTSDLFDDGVTLESLRAKYPEYLTDTTGAQFFKYGIGVINLLYNNFKNINDDLNSQKDNVKDSTYNIEIFLSNSFVSGNNKCDDPVNPTSLADKVTINAEISRITLFLMIFKYYDQINESYILRRTGGVSNFTIFTYYMKEYTDYLKEFFHNTWNGSELKTRIVTWAKDISTVFTSDKVRTYMENLPGTLAGVNGTSESYEDKPEIKEHFVNILIDMLKSFKSIATLAINLVKVVNAVVSGMNNPLEWVKLIMALIIGVTLYIIYYLLSITALIWSLAIGAVAVVVYKIYLTSFNLSLFVLKAIIFTILWILDYATGGHVLPLLRCENLPNIWYSNPGFANFNKYMRKFFCNFSCGSRYNPGGGMCRRIDSNQPSFCPQQLIYNTYLSVSGDASAIKILKMTPTTPDFRPMVNFFTKSDDEKKAILATAYNTKVDYLNNCNMQLSEYDFVNRFICYHIDDIVADPIVNNQLRNYCKFSYCQYLYNKKNDNMPAIEFVKNSELSCFCQDIYDSNMQPVTTAAIDRTPIYKKILVVLVVIILLVATFIAVYTITIVKPTSLTQFFQLNESLVP